MGIINIKKNYESGKTKKVKKGDISLFLGAAMDAKTAAGIKDNEGKYEFECPVCSGKAKGARIRNNTTGDMTSKIICTCCGLYFESFFDIL